MISIYAELLIPCTPRKIIVTCNPKTNPLGSMTLPPANSSHLLTSFGFTQPDPLADPYTWLSPYAYCGADPINFIDPTGLFKFHNIERNVLDRIICVFPSPGIEGNGAIDQDLEYNISLGIPVIEVTDMADLIAALVSWEGDFDYDCLVFNSHGDAGKFRIGSDKVNEKTDYSQLKDKLEGKSVFVYSCNSGEGEKGSELTKRMSKDMDCTVITSEHPIRGGYKFLGGPELSLDKEFNVSTDFKKSTSGSTVQAIYLFSLNRIGIKQWRLNNNAFIKTILTICYPKPFIKNSE